MSDAFGNHIVVFSTRRLISYLQLTYARKRSLTLSLTNTPKVAAVTVIKKTWPTHIIGSSFMSHGVLLISGPSVSAVCLMLNFVLDDLEGFIACTLVEEDIVCSSIETNLPLK